MSSLHKIICLMFKLLFLRNVLCFPMGNESHILNDQRQTGKYNIHISLRDVAIIEVDKNEFSDDTINNADEYYYDEEDLTISPISNWISTTIKTPALIINTSKSETVELQNTNYNKKVFQHSQFPHKQLPNSGLLESSLASNSSLLSASGRTFSESDMGQSSMGKEPVSHESSDHRLIYVPLLKNTQENSKEHSIPGDPSYLSARTVLPRIQVMCRKHQLRDANGNCRSLKRHNFLKSLLDMLKLMRMKN